MTSNHLRWVNDNIFDLSAEERVVGSYLYDRYNEMIARVQGLLVDPETFEVRYAVIKEGGFLFTEGKLILLPRPHYEVIDMGKIKTRWSRESLQQAPTVTQLEQIPHHEEKMILSYFDLEPYWESSE